MQEIAVRNEKKKEEKGKRKVEKKRENRRGGEIRGREHERKK